MSLIESRELFRIASLAFDLGYPDLGMAFLTHLLEHLSSHMAARFLLGEKLAAFERWAEAEEHFHVVLGVDPISLSALRGIGRVAQAKGSEGEESEYLRRAWAVHPYDATIRELLKESVDQLSPLALARMLTVSALHEESVPYYEAAFGQAADRPSEQPIVVLLLAEALWKTRRAERARSFLETLICQQPRWIRPKLILADIALEAREDALGVALLHDAAALDSSFVVAEEFFGQDERYESLVQHSLMVPVPDLELMDSAPGILRYLLHVEPLPEPRTVEKEAINQSALSDATDRAAQKGSSVVPTGETPGKAPCLSLVNKEFQGEESTLGPHSEAAVRLILSSRDRLIAKYGDDGFRELDAMVSELRDTAAESTQQEVIKIYADDEASLAAYSLDRVDPNDSRQIARLIRQMERELRRQSKKLNSLLIIGGDSVIPFYRLVNPTDDEDDEILSDWPYAAHDSRYLLAEFSVGRMPDGDSGDLEILQSLVENAIAHHRVSHQDRTRATSTGWLRSVRTLLGSRKGTATSLGYSAEIWAEAARSVYGVIGDAASLQLSPPLTDYDFLSAYEQIPTLGYFNLHGFRGSPYWYGHGRSEHGSPLLPVALTPLSISWANAQAALIYSEACYGADLGNGCSDGSIALSFLSRGALGFVGSTAMSYGALAPPLSGADLLGRHLWEGIVGGLPIGCALRRARSAFIRAAATQQGYLDGEDQKTLLSFGLYGDPSLSMERRTVSPELDAEPEVSCPPVACYWSMLESESLPVSEDLRERMQRSLPFLPTTHLKARPLIFCDGGCSSERYAAHPCGAVPKRVDGFPELIVTSQQQAVSKGGNGLQHVVKVTVGAQGEVTKVLMSRGGICIAKGSRRR